MSHDLISHETLALIIFSLVICSKRTSRGSGTKMMEMIGPSRKALGVFTILLSFIQVTTSGRALLSGKKIKRNSIIDRQRQQGLTSHLVLSWSILPRLIRIIRLTNNTTNMTTRDWCIKFATGVKKVTK